MKARRRESQINASKRSFNGCFIAAGGALVVFAVLPLANTLIATTPAQLWLAVTDPEVLRSIGLTFGAALAATGIALLGGVPLAYLLARRDFPGKELVAAAVSLPVVIPHTAAGVALLLVFGRRGALGAPLAALGLTFTDTFAGIVVAMLFVGLPFLVNTSREAFALIDDELESAALVDGASAWQSFWRVTLPLAGRGVFGGATMMWARAISEFGAVAILAYHPKIVPVLVFERFQGFGLNAAQPIALLLILVALLAFSLFRFALIKRD